MDMGIEVRLVALNVILSLDASQIEKVVLEYESKEPVVVSTRGGLGLGPWLDLAKVPLGATSSLH